MMFKKSTKKGGKDTDVLYQENLKNMRTQAEAFTRLLKPSKYKNTANVKSYDQTETGHTRV